jgi:hypothetical protein
MARENMSSRGPKQQPKPLKKRDMRQFTEKLKEDMEKLSFTKSPDEAAQFAIERFTDLTPEEQNECIEWLKAMDPRYHGFNIGM